MGVLLVVAGFWRSGSPVTFPWIALSGRHSELVDLVKTHLLLEHNEDDQLVGTLVRANTSYATSYQHLPGDYYATQDISGSTT